MGQEPLDEEIPDRPREHEDFVTDEELSEILIEIEGTTPEEIERGAEALEIGPPWEGTIVGYGADAGPLDADGK